MLKNKTVLFKLVSLRAKRRGSNLIVERLLCPLRCAQSPRNDTLLVSQKRFFDDKERKLFVSLCCIVSIFGFFIFSYGREKYSYDVSGKRNPFIPLITADGRLLNLDIVTSPEALSLQGIMYDANDISYAIVNNAIVKAGDMVAGSQVLKIEENKVSFVKDGQVSEIELKKGGE